MGRKVGAGPKATKTKPKTAFNKTQTVLMHNALELQGELHKIKTETLAWERRMTLLNFSAQVCGPETHPHEIVQFAGTFEKFVLTGETPSAEVAELKVAPKADFAGLAEAIEGDRRKMQEPKADPRLAGWPATAAAPILTPTTAKPIEIVLAQRDD